MAGNHRSDDIDGSSTLRDILQDFATSQEETSELPNSSDPSWHVLPPYSAQPLQSSSSSPCGPPTPMPRTSSAQRPLPQQRTASSSYVSMSNTSAHSAIGPVEAPSPPTLFNTPSRSIFSSGPPTASVSANTAQASLSSAVTSGSSRPLAALSATSASASTSRRSTSRPSEIPVLNIGQPPMRRRAILVPEKDVDDPSTITGVDQDMVQHSTPITLSRLFAASDGPRTVSRGGSHVRTASGVTNAARAVLSDTSTLSGHLLHRGLMSGCHSDITVHAFGNSYRLHRLLLDRVPFFASAFSGPWSESSAREMTLHPDETDSNITRVAFELALKRIYGANLPAEEDDEAVGLFATGCWLDMTDLVDSSVDALLRQMHPSKLDVLIKLVTKNYYGKAGDRILSSAKAMLCREGWEMPYEYWQGIPADIIREVIGGDPFYVPGEWERWFITLKILNRRLKAKAIEAGLISSTGRYLQPRPTSLRFFAVRFDTTYQRDSSFGADRHISDRDAAWVALYTSPEISPLLVLLDEGIHYVHLRFEQLQQLRSQKDILGCPVLPEKVISNALWMSMELRQRVLNAQETDLELELSEQAEDHLDDEGTEEPTPDGKGKLPEAYAEPEKEMLSDSWDGNGKPRKFWIPSSDSSSVMGGGSEAYLAANSTGGASWTPHMARMSASLEPSDVAWASDFTGEHIRPQSRGANSQPSQPARFSHYPPFRFSAEFPNPRTLKEKKRVYSQTVWYAGSMWNLYIQRVNTSKSQQLGIYLHRAKDKDPMDDPLAQFIPATVDDRIGQLEREMLLRKNERRNRHWRADVMASGREADPEDDTASASGGEIEGGGPVGPVVSSEPSTRTPRMSTLLRRADAQANAHKSSQSPISSIHSINHILDSDEENDELVRNSKRFSVSAMPAYIDARPTIKTYFKIYSPSKAGRMLSIYESAPDRFNFSQSWGWKSSQMVLDDGISGYDATKGAKDGKLRYMVVIGNV